MVIRFLFILFLSFTLKNSAFSQMPLDEDNDNLYLTPTTVQKLLANHQRAQKKQARDLLHPLRTREEGWKDNLKNFTTLAKLEVVSKDGQAQPILVLNTFRNASGTLWIFSWDPALGDKNYEAITAISKRINHIKMGREEIAHLDYHFSEVYGDGVPFWSQEKAHYMSEVKTSGQQNLWVCTVTHMGTNEGYKRKGLATLAVRELAIFVFNMTSVEFLNADANNFSRGVFKKCGFAEGTEHNTLCPQDSNCNFPKDSYFPYNFITFDGGTTYCIPSFYPGCGGNVFLTREEWDKKQKESGEPSNGKQ